MKRFIPISFQLICNPDNPIPFDFDCLLLFLTNTPVHVQRRIDSIRKRRHVHGELQLHLLHNLRVLRRGNEGDGQTLRSETTRTTDAVKVLVRLVGEVVVDHDVDSLHIDSATKESGGNQNTHLELLELLEVVQTHVRGHVTRDADVVEAVALQNARQLLRTMAGFHEDHNLVEVQRVQQIHQLLRLLSLQRHRVFSNPTSSIFR